MLTDIKEEVLNKLHQVRIKNSFQSIDFVLSNTFFDLLKYFQLVRIYNDNFIYNFIAVCLSKSTMFIYIL